MATRRTHLISTALAAACLAALAMSGIALAQQAPAKSEAAPAGDSIRRLLEAEPLEIAGQSLDGPALRRLYAARSYEPIWSGHDERQKALGAAYAASVEDGLDIPTPLPDPFKARAGEGAERELLLSDGALHLAGALAGGRVRPELWEDDWAVPPPAFDAVAGLEKALRTEKLAAFFAGLAPSDPRYVRLKAALARYRAMAARGRWPVVPNGPTLRPGMTDERVGVIRRRLIAEDLLPADQPGEDTFDAALDLAVRAYQERQGIVPDGSIGARTIAAMNVPVRARIEQIALTLERWRSLPRDFGRNYVFVNVPGESLEIFDNGVPVMAMKVVVGDPDHPTPVVQTRISAITFNPVWRVPTSIAMKEIAPKLRSDPKYLQKNDMVRKGAYAFEALPGPKNPLGQIKFETPNKFDVYLHDTSTHSAFGKVARALSHGCVRTENAFDLAVYVLQGPKWGADEIAKAIATAETQKVDAVRHLRVSIVYFTSFVDSDGTVEFRDDIYGRDKRLRAALQGAIAPVAIGPKPKSGVS